MYPDKVIAQGPTSAITFPVYSSPVMAGGGAEPYSQYFATFNGTTDDLEDPVSGLTINDSFICSFWCVISAGSAGNDVLFSIGNSA